VTEHEQTCRKQEFRLTQLSEAYKEVSARLAAATDEHKAQTAAWDLERKEVLAELATARKEKEAEGLVLRNERDACRDRARKLEAEVNDQHARLSSLSLAHTFAHPRSLPTSLPHLSPSPTSPSPLLQVDRVNAQNHAILEQSRADREAAQDELRQANTRLAELSAVANKYEAENAVVTAKMARAAERLAAAEQVGAGVGRPVGTVLWGR